MSEAKLNQILQALTALERDVGALKQGQDAIKQDVGGLKQDVGGLKQGQEALRQDMARQDKRHEDTVAAFRRSWSDMSDLYRRVREDVAHFEDRLEAKLSQINQSIQALRDSLERQDFRADELGRRISRLEGQTDV